MKRFILLFFFFVFFANSFLSVAYSQTVLPFTDKVYVKLISFQQSGNADSLLPYLKNTQAAYRKQAALALASVQDTTAIDALSKSLTDNDAQVRSMAAFALGQIGSPLALPALQAASQTEKAPQVLPELYEAVGKCGDSTTLAWLISDHQDATLTGRLWGIYRLALKGVTNEATAIFAIEQLQSTDSLARLAAAHYLSRASVDLMPYANALSVAYENETSVDVKMALALSFRSITTPEMLIYLSRQSKIEPDYRVRISLLRSLSRHEAKFTEPIFFAALNDPNSNVVTYAAEYLKTQGNEQNAAKLFRAASVLSVPRNKADVLYAAIMGSKNKQMYLDTLILWYNEATTVYGKAMYLKAFGADEGSHVWLAKEIFDTREKVLSTYGFEGLMDILSRVEGREKQAFVHYIEQALLSRDVALVGMAANALANPDYAINQLSDDWSKTVQKALDKCILPAEIETYQELQKAFAFVTGTLVEASPVASVHPFNERIARKITPATKVLITTSKGVMTLQLLPEDAPISAVNFVELAESGFFDKKSIHRVVPNFVVQDGCPRGDGWGSPDYNIISEFSPLRYTTGSVGMASAGKNTESSQWFISHSPTPHLDGRYTIFAQLTDGFDILHLLEVGDTIQTIQIVY